MCVASTSKDISVDKDTVVPVQKPIIWECPDCSPNEKYVLKQLQEHTRITDRNALWQLSWVTLNLKVTSSLTFVKVCKS